MRSKIRIIAFAAAICLLMSVFTPSTEASAKTVKKDSDEYKKIVNNTDNEI
ncbi:MAG: hypothetical protein K6G81_06365 [Lachnospiraceae bacterium]|nr:hypothetical protein [Lachnospiraceae bacterium]